MNDIKFSFIIPHKNCLSLLKRCVDSIPKREDVQIVIVDDNSDEISKPSLLRNGLEIVYLDANSSKGAGRARNEGLKRAKGTWLIFADADDLFVTKTLDEKMELYKNSDADIVFFNVDSVDADTLERRTKYSDKRNKLVSNHSKRAVNILRFKTHQPWGKMIKRSLVTQHNIKFSEVISSNDSYFSIVTGYYAKKVYVDPDVIYNWCFRHSGNICSNLSVEAWDSRLGEAKKRNSFLLSHGKLLWIRNLYVGFYDSYRKIGLSFGETFFKIAKATPIWLIIPHVLWFIIISLGLRLYKALSKMI